ncbi:MAG: DUF1553 domain-containing protein [Planctomycetaceae bacterium]|nr:DUF1553 domain-containing protein [Planctomycetales bacterium]MCB9925649.1 DUF1553 domain-containing protein [Planctomycetaceae bacterium]
MLSRLVLLALFAITVGYSTSALAPAHGASPVLEEQVLPILTAKCSGCHGADKQEGGFRATGMAAILAGSDSGLAIVAGRPEASRLYERIKSGEMPPEGETKLTLEETKLIHDWIADGREIRAFENRVSVTTTRIVPLMLLRCVPCHGHRRREADLDLRSKESILRGGKSGPAVISGKPEESLLVQRIHAGEMPPRRQLVSVSVKPMEATEVALIERWIADDMPHADPDQRDSQLQLDSLSENQTRESERRKNPWSFQSPRAILPSNPSSFPACSTEIDTFVEAELHERKLTPAITADRVTLIRRLSLDLTGLPPTPDEIDAFVADSHPLAYQRLAERLLASPHYGPRWGRHWLDVAGYADSEGAQNEDRIRPNMWRYRDYVIRAFNEDKPYDRFLREQIAGDELADYENADVITDELYDNLVATGFLRTAPDRTFANITNFVPDRLEVIADEIQILGSAVLGLTIHCARCHSHKFDSISQGDYYQLAALLKGALDEHDWLGPQERTLNLVTTSERQDWELDEKTITAQVTQLQEQLRAAMTAEAKTSLEEQVKQAEALRRPEPRIRALWSRGEPSPTFLLKRGNYLTPGIEVPPQIPTFLSRSDSSFAEDQLRPPLTTKRRLAFAQWLTRDDHPLTARVMVNRIWQHHFGRALVTTPGNFGVMGDTPSHPELLDWLSVKFVQDGWSVKQLQRAIVTSDAYCRSSQATADQIAADPDNRFLTHMPLRRMEAEVLRDSLLFVTDQLDETFYGPPGDVEVQPDGLVTSKRTPRGWRRSAFVLHRRTKLPTLLETFDSPQMGPNCVQRNVSIVAPQALHLLNDTAVHGWAQNLAEQIAQNGTDNVDAKIHQVYRIALGREAGSEELALSKSSLSQLEEQWRANPENRDESQQQAKVRALTNFCHAILNSAAFSYID